MPIWGRCKICWENSCKARTTISRGDISTSISCGEKCAPVQIHFQVFKFSEVEFLRLLIVFPCFSGSFAFHVFWIVHSNILSCFKSLVHRAPKRGRFMKKENLRKYCFLWQDLETVYGLRANCHLGTGGLWFVRQLLTIDNGEHNHTLCCKPPCSLEHHSTVDCHTFWTTVINCRKHAHCSCKCMSTNLNTSHIHHIHRKTYMYIHKRTHTGPAK